MFKGDRAPAIDALSLVELKVKLDPIDQSAPLIEATCCYVNTAEGLLYGTIELVHNESEGRLPLSSETLKAFQYFVHCFEQDQGAIIFGSGSVGSSNAETNDAPKVGLGGTS